MRKKIFLPCVIVSALFLGFLAGYTVFETVPSDSFVISGERETEIPAAVSDAGEAGRICINTASAVELTDLPGIGPALSQRIIEYREEHGPFASVDDLINVSGIGDRVLGRLRPYARCGE
jgi:competence protein ComEA